VKVDVHHRALPVEAALEVGEPAVALKEVWHLKF
jgi:hypothetical protein